MDLFSELKERGLIYQASNESAVKDFFAKKGGVFYGGFDPTGTSLHIGNLALIIFMKRLESAGLKPIVLVGGATGLIGDPSGKSQERNLLDLKTVNKNVCALKKQLSRFFDFGCFCRSQKAFFVNNYDWIKKVSLTELLRDIGKYFTVNEMIAKESVQKRMATGISFTEFSYMILQAFDFLNLYKKYNCVLQTEGSDQWGNMTAGIELVRKVLGKEVLALTIPLITKADGIKFGKTETGAVWLDSKLTSPYHFYQFWVNAEDASVIKYLKYYTFLSLEEIKNLESSLISEPEKRDAQKALAREITKFVHGEEALNRVGKISQMLFYGKIKELKEEELEEVFSGPETKKIEKFKNTPIAEFLVNSNVVNSKRQAREDAENKAIEINGEKISDANYSVGEKDQIFGKYILVKRGKKDYHFIKF
jgi:tyrosyl-tRNA synthetase